MIKFNRRSILVLALILSLSLFLSACSKKNVEGLVGSVNGEPITQEEFDADFEVFKNLYERELGEDALEQTGMDGKTFGESLKESILEKLIMEKLIAKESEGMQISVSDEDVQKRLEQTVEEMEGQENFDDFLSKNSISKEFFLENLRKELIVEKHKEEFLKTVSITDEDSMKYFEDNKDNAVILKASHILLATEEEAKTVLDRLNAGEDFATLATLESLDSVSAARGGDLGYFGKGFMIAEFEDAAMALEEGEISGIVKTEVGYHIIKVEEKKDTFDELKDEIVKVLKEQKYLDKVQALRDDAKVEKYLESSN